MNKAQLNKAIAFELGRKTVAEQNESSLKTEKNHEHGKHPNSLKNLKPYETGQSGNPGGRPVKFAKMKVALDRWGKEELGFDFWDIPPTSAKTMKDQVHWKIWHKAIHGDNKCIEILAQIGCLDD
jgi:hypothetical protein